MATFPSVLAGHSIYKYPISRTIAFNTQVNRFLDDTEQRWSLCNRMERFKLVWRDVPYSYITAIKAFYDSQKGVYGTAWNFVFDGVTYQNCGFDSDSFVFRETLPERYTLELAIKQQLYQPPVVAPLVTRFPTLKGGVLVQRPYTVNHSYLTMADENPLTRYRYTDWIRENPLRRWDLPLAAINQTELTALENFFIGHKGRLIPFEFEEPQAREIVNVRFAADELEVQYVQPNHWATAVALEEVK